MKKIIKQWGNSLIIKFDPEDVEIYKLAVGKVVDLSDMIVEDLK